MFGFQGEPAAALRSCEPVRTHDAPNADSLDRWVLRHQKRPWRYLRVCGCPPDLADDLVQEALLAALHKRVHDLEDPDAAAWLLGAVRNLWRAHLRRQGVQRRVMQARADLADRALEQCAPDDDGDAFCAALRACLRGIDGRARTAIELRYGEEESRESMAVILDLSVDGVKTLLRRTRAVLRDCVLRRLGAERRGA